MHKKLSKISFMKMPLYGKVLLIFAAICGAGLITLLALNHINRATITEKTTPTTATKDTQKSELDKLKSSAMKKLNEGNQRGGLADLRAALGIAKKSNNAAEILYLEQQIDFAENSEFAPSTNPAPATLPTKSSEPGYRQE